MFETKTIFEKIHSQEKNLFLQGSICEFPLNFEKDSRTFKKNSAYLAFKGETFDGLDFVENVLALSCPLVIYTLTQENKKKAETLFKNYPKTCFIGVSDVVVYAQKLAKLQAEIFLQRPHHKIIGITGSNGKTTNKEMLFHYLNSLPSLQGRVACTFGNFNNHIGVPLTILSLKEDDEVLIVEMGSNHPGEIAFLCDIALPRAGLITNIGDAHLEFFKTKENILHEKAALFHHVRNSGGLFVLDKDDAYLKRLADREKTETNVSDKDNQILYFSETSSLSNNATLTFKDNMVSLEYQKRTFSLKNTHITGKHNFKNLAATFLLSAALFPKYLEELALSAASFIPRTNRSSWIIRDKKHYYLDAYNANPSSMISALDAFSEKILKEKINLDSVLFILGDMNELGEKTQDLHQKVAKHLLQIGAKNAAFIGKYNSYYAQNFANTKYCFKTKEDFLSNWTALKEQFDFFFIKGSRSLQLESLLDI